MLQQLSVNKFWSAFQLQLLLVLTKLIISLKCPAQTGVHNLIEQVEVSTNLLKEHEHLFASQGPKVKQFMDIFSIPEMTLLAVANHFFITNNIEYDPVHLFKDVSVRVPTLMVLDFTLLHLSGLRTWFFPCWEAHWSIVLGCFLILRVLSLDALGSFL